MVTTIQTKEIFTTEPLGLIRWLGKLRLPSVERLCADPQSICNLADRIASINHLRDDITLKLICKSCSGRSVLLASKIPSKASTNLGAIQVLVDKPLWHIAAE